MDAETLSTIILLGSFLIMILLPGIDLSFRFRALAVLLIVRLAVSLIIFLIYRKNEKVKKQAGKVFSGLLSLVLILTSLVPAFVFRDYNGRPLTGKYNRADKKS